METKEELIQSIKEWMRLEDEIAHFQKQIKERKQAMKSLSESLIDVMKKNQIECFDIKGGSLIYKKNKSKKPINAKTLVQLLAQSNFCKNVAEAENITKYVMEHREEVYKEVIRRITDK